MTNEEKISHRDTKGAKVGDKIRILNLYNADWIEKKEYTIEKIYEGGDFLFVEDDQKITWTHRSTDFEVILDSSHIIERLNNLERKFM